MHRLPLFLIGTGLTLLFGRVTEHAQGSDQGTVITERFTSKALEQNRTGLDLHRSVSVYLPPGYENGDQRYPVVYYFHSFNWDNERMFADGNVQRLFDRAIQHGVIRPFILAAANFSTNGVGSFYSNSSTSGNWIDYTIKEVLPLVEKRYRTLTNRNSRGLAGEFIGGYAALKFAMLYPELFSSVYALHPVGTGLGLVPGSMKPDWPRILAAHSLADLEGDGLSAVFVAMAQAYLPNPDRPPFYCDFMVEMENGEPTLNVEHSLLLQSRFSLDEMLRDKADSLRRMRGIKLDWGRYDPNPDHVYANEAFVRKLEAVGIEHEAEEYRGAVWDKNWTEHGRVEDNVLPFFNRYLDFEATDGVTEK